MNDFIVLTVVVVFAVVLCLASWVSARRHDPDRPLSDEWTPPRSDGWGGRR